MVTTDKRSVVKSYLRGEGKVKTSNNSISTSGDGKTLYSYNTPIAYKEDSGQMYLNKDKYSVTTSSQQNIFRQEAKGKEFEEVSESELRGKIN